MRANLSNKSVILTGAAGGIGIACVARYLEAGANVVCVDLAEGLADTVERLAAGGAAVAVRADVSTEAGNEEALVVAEERFGGVDIVHANAALQVMGGAVDVGKADLDRMYATNLAGPYLLSRAAIPYLRRRGGGSIIFSASVLGIVADPDLAGYGAMKGGLRSLARSIAVAHGPDNIRCNTICPGDVETPMLEEFFAHQPDPAAARAEVLSHYPLGRFARAEDVAALAAFLASDDAAYISGTDIVLDGALLAHIY